MANKTKKVSVAETADPITIPIEGGGSVSGLFQDVANAHVGFVLAHGAGAGMKHPFLAAVSRGLAERQVSTLRYQFPYMEKGSGRPDSPPVAHAAVRSAIAKSASLMPRFPLFAGGKSFGGRMTSQAQAASPLTGVRGLIFLGFPLHPPGQPSDKRGEHLMEVRVPMLFLQGDRDEFADLPFLESLVSRLGARATLKLFPHANHSFHVPARSGRNDSDVMAEMLDVVKAWMGKVVANGGPQATA